MTDWVQTMFKKKGYNPDQPRDPAGVPTGGRWTASGLLGTQSGGYKPATMTSPGTRLFNKLPLDSKLNPNVRNPVVGELIDNEAERLIKDTEHDEDDRERGLDVIQNQQTGELEVGEFLGQRGVVKFPQVPDGYERVGLFHTHPMVIEQRQTYPSDPDMWKYNPMLRHGGVFAIGFSSKREAYANMWFVYPGDSGLGTPTTMHYRGGKTPEAVRLEAIYQ